MATTKKNQYEAMFLLGPVGQSEPETAMNLCRQIIERHGGEILAIKRWDERKLAYEIGGQKRGTYILSLFMAPGGAVPGIERDVKLSDAILRVLVLRADHLSKAEIEASEPQRPEPREERPDRWDRPMGDRPDRGPRGPRREDAAEAAAGKEG